jgi:AAA domain
MTLTFVDPPERAYANVLLYGAPKTGKSSGAATAPGLVLFLNADLPNATLFARSRDTDGRVKWAKWGGLAMLSEVMRSAYQRPTWDTVVLDPIGEAYRRLLEEASNNAVRPTLSQYGDVSTHIERFCRFMCEAPVNFVIVAHELSQKDEAEGTFERIAFTGTKAGSETLSQKLMGMVDIVGYTSAMNVEGEGRKWVAQLVAGKGRQGGDRFNCLGDWRELDLTEWFKAAGCHIGENSKAPQEAQEAVPA